MRNLAVAALALLASGAAFAQAVPGAQCQRPDLPPATRVLEEAEAAKFNSTAKAYSDCVSAYIKERNGQIEALNAQIKSTEAALKAQADAANAVGGEHNSFVDALNKNIAARAKIEAAQK